MTGPASAALFAPNGPLLPWAGCREPVSGLTHLAGALLFAIGGLFLWARCRRDRPRAISMAIYGASLVVLYSASATYHILDLPPDRLVFWRKLDHASVFGLIAGTFTPFYVNAARGWWRLGNLLLIWTLALVGVALKLLFIDMPDALSSGLYVGMGWTALIGYMKLASAISHRAMAWTFVGGLFYTAGAAIDASQCVVPLPGVIGFHEVHHMFVLGGSAVHLAVVARWVLPFRWAQERDAEAPASPASALDD